MKLIARGGDLCRASRGGQVAVPRRAGIKFAKARSSPPRSSPALGLGSVFHHAVPAGSSATPPPRPRAMSQFGPRAGPGGKRRGFSKETEAFLRGETPAATAHEPSSRDENSSASPGQRPFCPARFSTNRPVRSAEPLTSSETHPRATHRDVGGERRVQADRGGPPRHRFGGTRASKGAWISSQEPGRRRRPGRGQTPTGSRAAGSARVRDTNEGRDRGGEPARAGAVDGPGRPAGAR